MFAADGFSAVEAGGWQGGGLLGAVVVDGDGRSVAQGRWGSMMARLGGSRARRRWIGLRHRGGSG